jgi:hypothetical protein
MKDRNRRGKLEKVLHRGYEGERILFCVNG